MFKLSCIFLLQALLAVNAELIDLNKNVDVGLETANNYLREKAATVGPFPVLNIEPFVSYTEATSIGSDSLVRTGDCWADVQKDEVKVQYHYGLRLFAIILPQLTIDNQKMSGVVRIRNNSVSLAATIHHKDNNCSVTLDEVKIEYLQGIEVQASVAAYDGRNVEHFFGTEVVLALNKILADLKPKIEAGLQKPMCSQAFNPYSVSEAVLSQFISIN